MNVSNVFKLASVILFFNGLMSLFMTDMFFEMAAFTVNESLHTFGQFTGVTFLAMGVIAWKTVDLAGDNLKSFGKVYALTQLMWVGIIGYHVAIGAAGGATAIGNLAICAVLAGLFYWTSRD
jgi:hypothetical protein